MTWSPDVLKKRKEKKAAEALKNVAHLTFMSVKQSEATEKVHLGRLPLRQTSTLPDGCWFDPTSLQFIHS